MAACSSEKRRPSPSPAAAAGSSDPGRPPPAPATTTTTTTTTELGFLQSGVSALLRGALLKLLEVRPEDPVAFLADYFEKRAEEASSAAQDASPDGDAARPAQGRLRRALWHLSQARQARRTAFNNNVTLAYDSLSAGGKRKNPGVNGKLYSELLRLLCREGSVPEEIVAQLLRKIVCRDHEAVPFDIFRFGALTCLVLSEFLVKAHTLYDVLAGGSAAADKRVCLAVLGALEEALHTTDASMPIHYLEAGSKLSPDCLAVAMDKALAERRASVPMKKEEFLKRASGIFVSRVKAIQ